MRHLVTFRSKPTHKTDIQASAVGQKQKINKWRLRLCLLKNDSCAPILNQKFVPTELESTSLSLKARCQQDHFPSKGSQRDSCWHSVAGTPWLAPHGWQEPPSSWHSAVCVVFLAGWLVLAVRCHQLHPGSHFKCLY